MAIAADKSQTTHDPVRRWTLIVLGLIVVLFLYSIIADRMTPYTCLLYTSPSPRDRS